MHAQERRQQIAALVADTKGLLAGHALSYAVLDRIAARLESLAAQKHLWSESELPSPAGAERQRLYLVGEDAGHTFATYLSITCSGRRIPPHDHTTWACIAAVEGCEMNYLYERVEGGREPGAAKLRERAAERCEPGHAMVLMPEDIHSIANLDEPVARHLHFYGRALEVLDQRLVFDLAAGACKRMVMPVPAIRAID
jgi:predicted metal-dependent enzyme (double-stranded beta helix superfamily)